MIKYTPLIKLGKIFSPLPLSKYQDIKAISNCRLNAEKYGLALAKEIKKTNSNINLDTVQIDPYQYIIQTEHMEYLVLARTHYYHPQYHSKPK